MFPEPASFSILPIATAATLYVHLFPPTVDPLTTSLRFTEIIWLKWLAHSDRTRNFSKSCSLARLSNFIWLAFQPQLYKLSLWLDQLWRTQVERQTHYTVVTPGEWKWQYRLYCRCASVMLYGLKLEFHRTDTDTDTDIFARIVSRMSSCRPFSLPQDYNCPFVRAGHARGSSPTCPPTCPTRAIFLARMSVRDARVYTCKRVLYTISYGIYNTRLQNYTIGAMARIPNVGVGVRVGPVEFQL